MLGRPNLDRLHCDRVTFIFDIPLPATVAHGIMHGSAGHGDGEDRHVVLYANTYRVSGTPHVSTVRVFALENDACHIHLEFTKEERTKPPRHIKSPQRVATVLAQHAPQEPISFAVSASFTYKVTDGWESKLPLPTDLSIMPKNLIDGMFTHIEAIRLSRRKDNKVEQWLQIGVTEENDLTHNVFLQRERAFTANVTQMLLKEISLLSQQIVTHRKETSHAS